MKLFRIAIKEDGTLPVRAAASVEDCYVGLSWTGVGDLEHAGPEEINARLAAAHGNALRGQEQELAVRAKELLLFVHAMKDGDYVLAADEVKGLLLLGDMGDYYYVESSDHAEDGICHRRGVTWLHTISMDDAPPEFHVLLQGDTLIAEYGSEVSPEELESWLLRIVAPPTAVGANRPAVDEALIGEAIAVLREAMRSDDPERRERAAIAILEYARA